MRFSFGRFPVEVYRKYYFKAPPGNNPYAPQMEVDIQEFRLPKDFCNRLQVELQKSLDLESPWTDYNLFAINSPIINEFRSVIKKVLPYYKERPWNKNLWINGWVNYTKEDQYIEIHNHSIHENSYLSGTLSLTDMDDVITNFWIPIISYSKDGGPLSFPSLVGRMLIFPSFVPHEVTRVPTGARITTGFDLITDQAMTYFRKNSNDPKDPLSRAVKL